MRLVELMSLDPCRCVGCGRGNTPDGVTGVVGPFVDLEMEVGWNDHAYLCIDCGSKVGALSGMITLDEAKDLEVRVRRLETDLHETESERDGMKRRLRATQKKLLKVG